MGSALIKHDLYKAQAQNLLFRAPESLLISWQDKKISVHELRIDILVTIGMYFLLNVGEDDLNALNARTSQCVTKKTFGTWMRTMADD